MKIDEPRPAGEASAVPDVALATIYWIFFQIGALSFGGGLTAWLYREVVEKRKLLAEADFLGGLTLAQVLPGINMTNMSIYVGQRLRGRAGAITALVGLISVPFFAILGFATIYAQIKAMPAMSDFLDGMAAAAVGLLLSMGIRSVKATSMTTAQLVVMGLVIVAIGAFRLPMIPVIIALAPVSVYLAWPTASDLGDEPDA